MCEGHDSEPAALERGGARQATLISESVPGRSRYAPTSRWTRVPGAAATGAILHPAKATCGREPFRWHWCRIAPWEFPTATCVRSWMERRSAPGPRRCDREFGCLPYGLLLP